MKTGDDVNLTNVSRRIASPASKGRPLPGPVSAGDPRCHLTMPGNTPQCPDKGHRAHPSPPGARDQNSVEAYARFSSVRVRKTARAAFILACVAHTLSGRAPAFPSAEAYGTFAKEGRDGDVYRMTSPADSWPEAPETTKKARPAPARSCSTPGERSSTCRR
jgi:hypothetical protein